MAFLKPHLSNKPKQCTNTNIHFCLFLSILGTWNIRGEDETTSVAARLTNEEREDVLNMKKHPDLYNRMITSLAPTVWGHDDVKKGILCQIVGGNHKAFAAGKFRSAVCLGITHTTGASPKTLVHPKPFVLLPCALVFHESR